MSRVRSAGQPVATGHPWDAVDRVAEVAQSVVPDAKVSTKSGSDGRTTATIELPGSHPADVLAQRFVGIREALYEAELGMAKLVIKGTAVAPGESVAESP